MLGLKLGTPYQEAKNILINHIGITENQLIETLEDDGSKLITMITNDVIVFAAFSNKKGPYNLWNITVRKEIDEMSLDNRILKITNEFGYPDITYFNDFGDEFDYHARWCMKLKDKKCPSKGPLLFLSSSNKAIELTLWFYSY